ncbi:MAG: arsenate reductase family protein [Flavobacteriaceae bacterium]
MQFNTRFMRAFFYLSSCDTCKRIMKSLPLDKKGIELIDLKKNPLTPTQLDHLYALSECYEALFSKRAQLYKQRDLNNQNLTEKDYRTLLLEHYTFLKRPVLVYDTRLFIGNTAKVTEAAKSFLDEC